MPLYLPTNPYHGINAHLHSVLQTIEDGWSEFHTAHITHIAEGINQQLPFNYVSALERSFQIRTFSFDDFSPKRLLAKPDVTIGRLNIPSSSFPEQSLAVTPTIELDAEEAIDIEESIYGAVAIRQVTSNNQIGDVVAWLELLSPSNKRGGSGEAQYQRKRTQALHGGIVLIELDYLHHSPPIMRRIPSYPDGDEGAYPYTISLTDPRPNLKEGKLKVYGFGVDIPIPTIEIPLLNGDKITVNFDSIYQRTFASLRTYSLRADYDQLPQPIDAYHPQDREKIALVNQRAHETTS